MSAYGIMRKTTIGATRKRELKKNGIVPYLGEVKWEDRESNTSMKGLES